MIKGCHKSVVFLKDTGSELFDEAYFVVKPNTKCQRAQDIVTEASRLASGFCEEKARKHIKLPIFTFIIGGVLGAVIVLLLI